MKVRQFVDEGLGNAAHLVLSERLGVAALIDPLRDVDRYLDAAARASVRISHVLETHIHADFISGSRELAARTGAQIVASANAELGFEHAGVTDGESLIVGDLKFEVLATPGHTPEHVSYLARSMTKAEQPAILFSGGSLLVGAVARTDLLGHEHTQGLTHQLFHSLHAKILPLPDDVAVYPTHGAGSFCTAAPGAARSTTIGQERQLNPFVRLKTPEALFAALKGAMPSYPAYFAHMRAINQRGPRVLGQIPVLSPLPPQDIQSRMARGEAVVDTRPVGHYLAGHIPGVYHVELREAFGVWVGWVVPFGSPVILVTETPAVHDEAVRQLTRIGYEDLPGYLQGGMAAWEGAGLPIERIPTLTIAEVRGRLERGESLLVLDVRQNAEWADGHIPQAQHVELGTLATAELTLPRTASIVTHCGHEQRSATALSILERSGYQHLHLMDGGWADWEAHQYPVALEPAGS